MDDNLQDIQIDFEVPNLSSKSQNSDVGNVRKSGKKRFEKDEHINAPIPKEDVSKSYTSATENNNNGQSSPSQIYDEPNINLSREELLKLLSVFEGELQARDEVIAILKSECAQNTDTRYGLTSQPLKALQRDSATLEMTSEDNVCEQTKEQLKNIIQQQKEQYRKLQQMHLASVDKYRRLSVDTEDEKQKHQEYIMKSDDFVNLLEHDRERLRQLIEEEKATRDIKEKELTRKLKENKEEVLRLKSLSLELVEERHQQLKALDKERQLTTTLRQQVEDLQSKVKESEIVAATEKEHATQLENELEEQTNKAYKEYEALTEKLVEEEAKTKQKEEKIKSLGRQMKKLKCVDKNLRKTDDQLWRIKEKLEQEERHEDLLEEVELLRKTVAGMQEAEKIYTQAIVSSGCRLELSELEGKEANLRVHLQAQEDCKELKETLQHELSKTAGLRTELETLRQSVRNRIDAERCVEEAMFRLDEVQQLFEAERKKVDKMKQQSQEFRERLTKIDESEKLLQLSEVKLKQVRTVAEERKQAQNVLETKLQLEQEKSGHYEEIIEDERVKVTEMTQKTIEESKKVLKLKEKIAALETKRIEKTEALHRKLESAEESISHMITKEKADQMESLINNLRKQVEMLKKRLDQLETETEKKGKETRIAKEEAEIAKQNLNTSAEKLKRLVALGLNEQMVIAQCEEFKQKQSTLEITNASLREEVKSLESKLQRSTMNSSNKNNNNFTSKNPYASLEPSQSLNLKERCHHTSRKQLNVSAEDSKPFNTTPRPLKYLKQELSFDRIKSDGASGVSSHETGNLKPRKSTTYPIDQMVKGSLAETKPRRPFSARMLSTENRKTPPSPTSTKSAENLPNSTKSSDCRATNKEPDRPKVQVDVTNSKERTDDKADKKEETSLSRRPLSASHIPERSPRIWLSGKVSSKIAEIHTNSQRRNESRSIRSTERNSSNLRSSSNLLNGRAALNSPRVSRDTSSSTEQR